MELHFTPEQEAQLYRMAQDEGKTPEELIADAVLDISPEDQLAYRTLDQRLSKADTGIFIEKEEVDRRFRTMMEANQ